MTCSSDEIYPIFGLDPREFRVSYPAMTILAGGVRDMADWVNKLYGQAFAAVYVQPGAKVAVHLEQPLDIDYDAKGRRVHHRTGEAHASDLD